MDIKTLQALGISPETLGDRIVDQAVETLLSATGFDPEYDQEVSYASRFQKEIASRIQKAVDAKIAALAEEHLVPKVGELIENSDLRKTNSFGEPTSPSMTFKEYLASRADVYMSENTDWQGRSKDEATARNDGHNWKVAGPRLVVLMQLFIKESMEAAAKSAITDINKVIAKNIEQAAAAAIAAAANAVTVSVNMPR